MKIPKSKYYYKNVIETHHIEGTTIEIEVFYDLLHKGNRYSCTVKSIRTQYPTGHYNHKSYNVCGGYGKDNQITLPTYESALLKALEMSDLNTDNIRDFKLKLILS